MNGKWQCERVVKLSAISRKSRVSVAADAKLTKVPKLHGPKPLLRKALSVLTMS